MNKRTTTEKRLSVRLYLSLVLYTVVGFGLAILLDYIFQSSITVSYRGSICVLMRFSLST